MEFDDLLRERRSIREFDLNFPIMDDLLGKIIDSSFLVPMPSGKFPINIIQISSMERREQLRNALKEGRDYLLEKSDKRQKCVINYYYQFVSYLPSAPVILAFSVKKASSSLLKNDWKDSSFITLGEVLMTISLKSADLGLSSSILTAPLIFAPKLNEVLGQKGCPFSAFMAIGKMQKDLLVGLKETKLKDEHFIKI